ncbi:MAG: bifunctional methylenetetrahydrofolate dehydrogenase/methenyltetrahydrofolate cyclohydrolase FolD [Nitrospirae bacterium]|nr:bifunctional methylenetetrahydrofolate dehydrogenase/methenyltetrahydrofolate cyclohydrolase FolD [Nitrospirota bacterium]
MPAQLIDGKRIALEIREEIRKEVEGLKQQGIQPGLTVVLVGEDPASKVYVKNKGEACRSVGIHSEEYRLPETVSEAELTALIRKLNEDQRIHGILVQLPLPRGIRKDKVLQTVSPLKDVDGFHEINAGKLLIGPEAGEGFVPCTPLGIMRLVDSCGIPIEGKEAVVVGRSNIVGKPAALLLLQRNATVTLCHSKTQDLADVCRRADILVAAIGRARMVAGDWVKPGAVVIDVGMNRLPDGKLCGDVDFEAARRRAGWITPVPGGVGPMTIALLLHNTVLSAKRRAGLR